MTSHVSRRLRKISCLDVAEYVQQELDRRLSVSIHKEIKAHLRRCPNCTAYLDSLKKTILLYRRVPCPPISKKAEERLFAVLKLRLKPY